MSSKKDQISPDDNWSIIQKMMEDYNGKHLIKHHFFLEPSS